MPTKEAVYAEVEAREHEMIDFLQELLAFKTENPPGRNYPQAAAFLTETLADWGYTVEQISVPKEVVARHYPERVDHKRVNVLGRKGPGDGPHIHFTGHFDVVPAGEDWTRDPYEPVIENGRVYGRGASDMKSGIVASLFAVQALEAAGVPVRGSITQSMTVDEETGGFTGLGYLVEEGYVCRENTDYCVYTECFDSSRICLGHRGVLKFRIVAHGEKAHGCMAHSGENAVIAMQDFLARVNNYRDELHDRSTDLPVTPRESQRADVTVTMVDAGYSENIVPDRCAATFYRVLVPDESIEEARAEVRELMVESEAATGMQFDYEEIMYAEPTSVSADCKLAQTYTEHILEFHDTTKPVLSPGSDDQRFVVNDARVEECIVYGPGLLDQAHVVDEYVPITELVTATKVMATATADLMGGLE